MAKQNEEYEAAAPTKRGSGYPLSTLDQAIRFGKAVQECGGATGPVPKSVIAKRLGVANNASAFNTQVASAKTYGVVDGYTDLSLTELANDYFHPTEDGSKRRAELAFIKTPAAFAYILKRFDGGLLPKPDVLTNLLMRQKIVPASWASRTASFFRSAAISLGLIDGAGILRYEAELHVTSNGMNDDEPAAPGMAVPIQQAEGRPIGLHRAAGADSSPGAPAGTKHVWVFADGAGRIETPKQLLIEDWEQLKAYVETVLKPREARKEG